MKRFVALFCILAALFAAPAWAATPALDTAHDVTANSASAGSTTITMPAMTTAAGVNNIGILVLVFVSHNSTVAASTAPTATGLTFSQLKSCPETAASVAMDMRAWYAPSASALSSKVITINTGAGSVDALSAYAVAIQNLFDINNPLDSNAGATSCAGATGMPTKPTLTTTQVHDLLYGLGMHTYGGSPGGGLNAFSITTWTLDLNSSNTVTSQNNQTMGSSHLGVSATQSGTNVDLTTAEAANPVSIMGLAFTGDNNAGATNSNQGMLMRGMP